MKPDRAACAGIVSRGAAFVVDVALTVLASTVGYLFVRAVAAVIGVIPRARGREGDLIGYLSVLPIAFVLFCVWFWTLFGQTPGMMLLGVRVVTFDGTNPGVGRSLLRALGYWVSAILFLGFAWIAFDRHRQGFHDKIAGTYVVYDSESAVLRS